MSLPFGIVFILLESNYNSLNSQYNTLENNYENLQGNYNSLQSNYNTLQSNYNTLEYSYNNLETSYKSLDEDYQTYKNNIEFRFGDGSDCQLFITPNDVIVKQKTQSILGTDYDGVLSWDDMKKINNWVGNNINYNHDTFIGQIRNCYQYPSETLDLGWGDCEDHAVLMISLCKAEENVNWIHCAIIKFVKNGENLYHACVFVNVADDKLFIFDPTDKPNWYEFWTDIWHSSSAKSEPDALNEYRLELGASSIQVLQIFNENWYHTFDNNQEFYNYF